MGVYIMAKLSRGGCQCKLARDGEIELRLQERNVGEFNSYTL